MNEKIKFNENFRIWNVMFEVKSYWIDLAK